MTDDQWLAKMKHLQKTDPASYKAEMAAHEAEMIRTAKLHQAEFQRTGARTVYGTEQLDLGPIAASKRPGWSSPPAADPMKTARKLNPKGHTE